MKASRLVRSVGRGLENGWWYFAGYGIASKWTWTQMGFVASSLLAAILSLALLEGKLERKGE